MRNRGWLLCRVAATSEMVLRTQAGPNRSTALAKLLSNADRLAEGTTRLPSARLTVTGQWRTLGALSCFVSITTASFYSSPDFIELAFRTPRDRICDPAVDVGFMPAGPVD